VLGVWCGWWLVVGSEDHAEAGLVGDHALVGVVEWDLFDDGSKLVQSGEAQNVLDVYRGPAWVSCDGFGCENSS